MATAYLRSRTKEKLAAIQQGGTTAERVVADAVTSFRLNTARLNSKQVFELAKAEIASRDRRHSRNLQLSAGFAAIAAITTIVLAIVVQHPSNDVGLDTHRKADAAQSKDARPDTLAVPPVPDSVSSSFPDASFVAYYGPESEEAAVYRVPFQAPVYPDSIWVRGVQERTAYVAYYGNDFIELTALLPDEFTHPEPGWESIQVASSDLEKDGNPEFIFVLHYGSHMYTAVLKYHVAATAEGLLREEAWQCVGFMENGFSVRFRKGGLQLSAGAGNTTQWVLAGGRMIETELGGPQENRPEGPCSKEPSGQ